MQKCLELLGVLVILLCLAACATEQDEFEYQYSIKGYAINEGCYKNWRHIESSSQSEDVNWSNRVSDLSEAMKLCPREIHYIILAYRGFAKAEMKAYDDALADLTASLQLEPKKPGVLYNRARLYMSRKRFDDAFADIAQILGEQRYTAEEARKMNNSMWLMDPIEYYPFLNAVVTRGSLYCLTGRKDRGIDDLKIVALSSNDPAHINAVNEMIKSCKGIDSDSKK